MGRMDSFIKKKCLILAVISILSLKSYSEDADNVINKVINTNKIIFQGNSIYFPLFSFIKNTSFLTYEKDVEKIKIEQLGNEKCIILNLKDKNIISGEEVYSFENNLYEENEEFYMEVDLFKNLFMNNLENKKAEYVMEYEDVKKERYTASNGQQIRKEELVTIVTSAITEATKNLEEKIVSKDFEEEIVAKVMKGIAPLIETEDRIDESLREENLKLALTSEMEKSVVVADNELNLMNNSELENEVISKLVIKENENRKVEEESEEIIEEIVILPKLPETFDNIEEKRTYQEKIVSSIAKADTNISKESIKENLTKNKEKVVKPVIISKANNKSENKTVIKEIISDDKTVIKSKITELESLNKIKPAIINEIKEEKIIETVINNNLAANNNQVDIENLKKMKDMGLLTEEDYQILLEESNGYRNEEALYSLSVNGRKVSNMYRIQKNDGKIYFPLFEFLEDIQFTNYKKDGESIKLYLGDSLREVDFDFKERKIKTPSDAIKEMIFDKDVYIQEEEVYIESGLFEKLFLSIMRVNEDKYALNMSLNFSTTSEIQFSLIMKEEKAKNNKNNELIYTNEDKLFELGYTRIQLDKTFDKEKDGKTKNDWSGSLEYQGAFLYGNLITSYGMKEKKIGNVEIEYPEVWKEHTLKIGNYKTSGDSREWGLRFAKEKGYYNSGKNYVIRERVPVGSRAELIYMGFTLEIQDAEEGIVEFNNPEIKSDRTYELKVYSPDGKIAVKEIKTTDDYNQQNKKEVEYDVNIQEDHESGKIKTESNVYYGITNNLTVGAGYKREVEEIDKKNKYVDDGRLELVYSDYLKSMPYTFRVGGEKTFNDYIDKRGRDFSKRYQYDYLGQLTVNNWKFVIEERNYGRFYEEKRKSSYRVEYKPANWISLGYEYNKNEKYSGEKENESRIDVTATKSYKKLMTTVNYARDTNNKDEYNVNFYYTGFERFSTRLENKWKENKKGKLDYEAALTLYNNNYRGKLDYTLSAGYSEKYKDKVTLSFTMRLDDWFKFTGNADKEGNQRFGAGIDKIVDLKNMKTKVDSMSTSRVRAITFIDSNNNNHYDEGEIKIDGVEVQIGRDRVTTDKNGEAMFYGVANSILYDLKPTIKKPSFTLGGNAIKVKGKSASTIDAYIPIKPMVTLTGKIEFDKKLTLTSAEKQEIYGDILVKVKGIDGKEIELTMPDNTGSFDVSGLFPEKYQIEVLYLGTRFDLPMLDEVVELAYIDDTGNIRIAFTISDKLISLKK